MIPDYSVVVGVDKRHLDQLSTTLPTWAKSKPSLIQRPWIVFYDVHQVTEEDVYKVVKRREDVVYVPWPPPNAKYDRMYEDRFGDPQRSKMLAGFVHVPGQVCRTEYWLKLDTDTIATGRDPWIQPNWFEGSPAIISHPWGFTRPPDQMLFLDQWVAKNKEQLSVLSSKPPLNLVPEPNRDRLNHERIISWCAFFHTTITRFASSIARQVCGEGKLPVPSQDGYMWYVATRMGYDVVRTSMKRHGWEVWSTRRNIQAAAARVLYG